MSGDDHLSTPARGDACGAAPAKDLAGALARTTPRAWVTHLIIAVNVVVLAVMGMAGVHVLWPDTRDIVGWGGNFGLLTTSGEWWRLITCTFVHIGLLHLAFNMYVLFVAGPLVERLVGNLPFAALYLVSGLAGSVASTAWSPMVVSAGASGAVFGVYGALMAFLLRRRGSIPRAALVPLRNGALVFVGFNIVIGMALANIDMAAHLGGLAAGFVCGIILGQPAGVGVARARSRRALLVAGLGAAIAAGAVLGLARSTRASQQHVRDLALQAAYDQVIQHYDAVIARHGDLMTRHDAGEVSADELAAALERDILPAWREVIRRTAAVRGLEPAQRRVVDVLLEIMKLRAEEWRLTVEGVRTGDPEVQRRLDELHGRMRALDLRFHEAAAAAR